MKSQFASASTLFLLSLITTTAFGQWQASSNGVFSSISQCFIETSNGSILSGTSNGIYRSTSSGDNWSLSSTGIPSSDGTILRFAKNGNRIFAGTREGVYYSDNDGVSWSLSEIFGFHVFGLEVISTQIFAGTMGAGIFKSTDNGISWSSSNNGLLTDSVYSLLVNGNDLLAGTYGEGIFLSSDQGSSWSQEFSQSDPTIVRTLAATSNRLLAGVSQLVIPTAPFNSLYKSSDNGNSWTMFNYSGLPTIGNLPITALYSNGSTVLLASNGQIYRSIDNGINWTAFMDGITSTTPYGIACFEETSDYIFCGVEAGGAGPIFRISKSQVLTSISPPVTDSYMNLFPNPSDGTRVMMDYKLDRTLELKWLIFDNTGRLVFEKQISESEGQIAIPITLESGTYVSVLMSTNGFVKAEPLVVGR